MKINHRLFDHYGIDTSKHLGIKKKCPKPWDTILIDKRGSCFACECQSWLPQSIGNLQISSLHQIIDSDLRRQLQDSIKDYSYRYCNNKQCSWLLSRNFGFFHEDVPDISISNLRLAIDDSCNLRCPSCRTGLIFHKEGARFKTGIRLADKIISWLKEYDNTIKVHIGSDGDPFASHVYRHFMFNSPKKKNIRYSLLTNGLMFEEFYASVPHVMDNLEEVGVSIDGATKSTYEKLRLGGKWEKLRRNMDCVAHITQRDSFVWSWHMVVQKDNWREMPLLLELAKEYGVENVYFNRIQDWNTGIDFSEQKFYDTTEFKETVNMIKDDPVSRTYSLL